MCCHRALATAWRITSEHFGYVPTTAASCASGSALWHEFNAPAAASTTYKNFFLISALEACLSYCSRTALKPPKQHMRRRSTCKNVLSHPARLLLYRSSFDAAVLLKRGSTPAAAAVLDVYGADVAELFVVATRQTLRRQGCCRLLVRVVSCLLWFFVVCGCLSLWIAAVVIVVCGCCRLLVRAAPLLWFIVLRCAFCIGDNEMIGRKRHRSPHSPHCLFMTS